MTYLVSCLIVLRVYRWLTDFKIRWGYKGDQLLKRNKEICRVLKRVHHNVKGTILVQEYPSIHEQTNKQHCLFVKKAEMFTVQNGMFSRLSEQYICVSHLSDKKINFSHSSSMDRRQY